MQTYECTAITTPLYPPKDLHQNIKFTMEEESNGELALLDTSLKRNDRKIFALVYRKLTHTIQHLHYNSSTSNTFQGKCCFLLA